MLIGKEDSAIIRSKEVHDMMVEYRKRFGEQFVPFNYADFRSVDGKRAAEIYKETLAQALAENRPYRIRSKMCDFFGH